MDGRYEELLGFIPVLKDETQMPLDRRSYYIQDLWDAIYRVVEGNPEYDRMPYKDILEEKGIKWEWHSMEDADVSELDERTIVALLLGITRAERFCDGTFLGFINSGAVLRWLERLEELAGATGEEQG